MKSTSESPTVGACPCLSRSTRVGPAGLGSGPISAAPAALAGSPEEGPPRPSPSPRRGRGPRLSGSVDTPGTTSRNPGSGSARGRRVAEVAGPVLLSVSVSWTRDQVAESLACFPLTVLPSGVSFPPLGPPGWGVPSSTVLGDPTTSPYPYPTAYGFVARLQPQPSSSLGQVRGRFLPPGSFVSGPAP